MKQVGIKLMLLENIKRSSITRGSTSYLLHYRKTGRGGGLVAV